MHFPLVLNWINKRQLENHHEVWTFFMAAHYYCLFRCGWLPEEFGRGISKRSQSVLGLHRSLLALLPVFEIPLVLFTVSFTPDIKDFLKDNCCLLYGCIGNQNRNNTVTEGLPGVFLSYANTDVQMRSSSARRDTFTVCWGMKAASLTMSSPSLHFLAW